MIELRCDTSLHAKFHPERDEIEIKCKSCTRVQGRPVYHRWPLAQILEQYQRGEIGGVCPPAGERFVHWRVSAA